MSQPERIQLSLLQALLIMLLASLSLLFHLRGRMEHYLFVDSLFTGGFAMYKLNRPARGMRPTVVVVMYIILLSAASTVLMVVHGRDCQRFMGTVCAVSVNSEFRIPNSEL